MSWKLNPTELLIFHLTSKRSESPNSKVIPLFRLWGKEARREKPKAHRRTHWKQTCNMLVGSSTREDGKIEPRQRFLWVSVSGCKRKLAKVLGVSSSSLSVSLNTVWKEIFFGKKVQIYTLFADLSAHVINSAGEAPRMSGSTFSHVVERLCIDKRNYLTGNSQFLSLRLRFADTLVVKK